MKICAVTTWPPHRDGVALYSAELYSQITKSENVKVIANVPRRGAAFKCTMKRGELVWRCWRRGAWYPLTIFRAVSRTGAPIVHLQHGWLLYGGLVSSIFFPLLLLFLRLKRKPCIVTIHTVVRRDANLYNNPLINLLARTVILFVSSSILKLSNRVIVHNRLMKKVLQKGYGSEGKKIVVIPHGVKERSRKPDSSAKEGLLILSLGFLRKGKAIGCLIEAFKRFLGNHPDAELAIVGGSHAHDKIRYSEVLNRPQTWRVRKKVVFTGFLEERNLETLIWKSDIIVLQSTEPSYVEASGALARVANYGKPVVCTKVPKFQGGLQDGEDCILVGLCKSTELTEAFLLLARNDEMRRRLGKNLREKFASSLWSDAAEEHLKLYRRVLKSQKRKCRTDDGKRLPQGPVH